VEGGLGFLRSDASMVRYDGLTERRIVLLHLRCLGSVIKLCLEQGYQDQCTSGCC